MTSSARPGRSVTPLHVFLLLFGAMAGSSAVIFIRLSTEHPFLVASYRLLIAALVLTPFFIHDLRTSPISFGWKQISWAAVPAIAIAVHFMSWVIGARQTLVVNASLIANLTPVVMPFFLWLFYREKINRLEVMGTLFTLTGLGVLGFSTLTLTRETLWGDVICLGSMLAFACYLALGRMNGGRISLWLYMVPLYYIAGIICLISALPLINPVKSYSLENIIYILALGLIPTVISHTVLNYSMKHFRGQVVSVNNLAQPIYAGLLAYLIFQEIPGPVFYVAAVIIVFGILIVLYSGYTRRG